MKNSLTGFFHFKYLLLFVMLYLTADLASNVVVYKLIKYGDFTSTAGILIFPFTYLFIDIIAEVYGYGIARQVIWFDLICNLVFSAAIVAVVQIPSPNENMTIAYNSTLGNLLYISLGALIGGIVSEFINIYAITKLKILLKGRYFWVRSITSSCVGMFILLLIANLIGLAHFTGWKVYFSILFTAYLFEVVFVLIMTIPTAIIVKILKYIEDCDIYDLSTNLNPFRLQVD